MKLHLDIGPFCWQFVSLLSTAQDEATAVEVIDLESEVALAEEDEEPTPVGFSPNKDN